MKIRNQTLKRFDLFRLSAAEISEDTATPCSLLGTCVAIGMLIFFSLQQFLIFAKHHPTESRVTVPRQIGLRADMIPFGAITYKDGERYVNESLFRWEFTYRAIFHGDLRNEEFPRQYHSLAAVDCSTYFTILDNVEPKPYEGSPYPTADTGRDARCVDWKAAKQLLEEAKSSSPGLSSTIQLEGRYGEPAYWFLEASLLPCAVYGPKENITCLSLAAIDEVFSSSQFDVDVPLLENLAPGIWKWSNHFSNFNHRIEHLHEMFFNAIQHIEEDKYLPSINAAVETTHLTYDSTFVRSRPRGERDEYVKLFFRLSSTVQQVEVSYFTLESALEGVGAWHGALFFAFGFLCIMSNILVDKFHVPESPTEGGEVVTGTPLDAEDPKCEAASQEPPQALSADGEDHEATKPVALGRRLSGAGVGLIQTAV